MKNKVFNYNVQSDDTVMLRRHYVIDTGYIKKVSTIFLRVGTVIDSTQVKV